LNTKAALLPLVLIHLLQTLSPRELLYNSEAAMPFLKEQIQRLMSFSKYSYQHISVDPAALCVCVCVCVWYSLHKSNNRPNV